MTEKQLIQWLRDEAIRADKDYEMATDPEDANFYLGEYEAYTSTLSILGEAI
jgi:hypothetical protein